MTTTSQSPNPPSRNYFTTKPFIILVVMAVLLCSGLLIFKLLKDNTTLSFSFLLDGKPLSVGIAPKAQVDGQPFTSGLTIMPGPHKLTAELQNAESFERHVWVFYGDKNLGALPLESSKGSLLVSVNPSPASVVVRRGVEAVGNGDAPLTVEKLLPGNYELEIKRGEYKETHPVIIQGKQRTEAKIDLNICGVNLSSDPADAEFQLSGNGRQWDGKLPTLIGDVPVGDYRFTARRKGWEVNTNISVGRGVIQTNKIEFTYGSIEVTSEPTGLVVSMNGVEIGKTPLTLQEMRPGQYALSVTDGENDLMTNVTVGSKEAVKHAFVFHYGTVQLSSTPTGATVIRKGKEIGKTPLTLNHIPAGDTMLELRLQDYASTNLPIQTVEGVTNQLSAKLISEHYLQAMKQAHEAFGAGQFDQSQKFLAAALEIQPDDSSAMQLRDEVSTAAAKAEDALRTEQANAKARTLASLTWLNFQNVISDCTDTRQIQYPVQMVDTHYETYRDYDGKYKQREVKGTPYTVMQTRTESTFNPTKFSANYAGRTFGFNCPDKWSVSKVGKDGGIMLKQTRGLFGSDNISVTAPANNPDALKSLQKGQKVTIKGVLTKCEPGVLVQTLYLENAENLDNQQLQKPDATPKLSTSNPEALKDELLPKIEKTETAPQPNVIPVVSSEATPATVPAGTAATFLYPVDVGGRWGFVNKSGETMVNPQFERAKPFSEGLAGVRTGGRWGFIGENGKFSVNPQFDAVGNFVEGLAPVRLGKRWGFINPAGKFAINPQFDEAACFTNSLARVKLGGRFGYINPSGTFVDSPTH